MMGQQQSVAGSTVRRMILALAVATLMAILSMAMTSEPAFAKGGCKAFGQHMSDGAQNAHPYGQQISEGAKEGGVAQQIGIIQDHDC
jgi:hypothetical protein